MSQIFCCSSTVPYKARRLDHEPKFEAFLVWAHKPDVAVGQLDQSAFQELDADFVVQLVRQINFGPLESKRYFAPDDGSTGHFVEITENDLIQANFKKLNAFKNFKCSSHNKFFEVNLYQKNPFNTHHWRSDIDRPGSKIDL